jgi:hypothetical protein
VWGRKCETGRCHGEAASSIIAKVRGDVFARFHAVALKHRGRTRNSQFGLFGPVLRATTTAVWMVAQVRNVLDADSHSQSRWPHHLWRSFCYLDGEFETHWWHGCLLWLFCVDRYRCLCWAEHSSRGVLLREVCLTVIYKPQKTRRSWSPRAVEPWKLCTKCSLNTIVMLVINPQVQLLQFFQTYDPLH